jgi:uncharacterized protein YjiS (DUF1127 family)
MSAQTIYSRRPYLTRLDGVRALGQHLVRFGRYFLTCLDVARQRRQLLTLDESALKDIGISHTDALREAGRDFWDIPENLKPGN